MGQWLLECQSHWIPRIMKIRSCRNLLGSNTTYCMGQNVIHWHNLISNTYALKMAFGGKEEEWKGLFHLGLPCHEYLEDRKNE